MLRTQNWIKHHDLTIRGADDHVYLFMRNIFTGYFQLWDGLFCRILIDRKSSRPHPLIKRNFIIKTLVRQVLILVEIFEDTEALRTGVTFSRDKKSEILLKDIFICALNLISSLEKNFRKSDTRGGIKIALVFTVEGGIISHPMLCDHPINCLNAWFFARHLEYKAGVCVH